MVTADQAASLKDLIINSADKLGIDKIGFAGAEPFCDWRKTLESQKVKGYTTGFEHPIIEERLNPQLIMPEAKSFIAIALAYPSRPGYSVPQDKEDRRGSFARASWGVDYHHILRERLDRLRQLIMEHLPQAECMAMVDTGPFMDVAVAERAGLGFIGRNSLLITPEFGSYVYLGELLTNIPFVADQPIPNGCGDCVRCIRSCPTQALLGDGTMNGQLCLSYQTQTKGHLGLAFRRKISHVIYGCDICQLTCPYNQGLDFHLHSEMEPVKEQVHPSLKPMLTLSNHDFKQQFGHLAGSWRGKKPLQRNAIMALANYRDQTALPLILELIEKDPRPVIRASAAYAVSMIQRTYNQAMIDLIVAQLAKETDPKTIEEMKQAIQRLQTKKEV